ncbi:MAG TPA: ABATE domain-containing protein [Mycobacterium sp.]|uniref:CGNR zinc finger domain-containing protein n=1 Tax=Mycobacterium sp. TaxID=1785 RepID=UPI002BC2A019|nr:ABATE domain-containing protein [Mycobacterium sp.]HME79811.1 ABATE domain-containing protein [Mycobacterium sp.]
MGMSTGEGPSLRDMQGAGFPMGAEPLVALDLADTLVTVTDPPTDLIADPAQASRWWRLQAGRLPDGPEPDPASTRRLRAAIRDLFDAHLEHRAPRETSLDDINAAAASAPVSPRIAGRGDDMRADARWHTEFGGNAALAAVAQQAIALICDASRRDTLRRCANPNCSMLFLAHTRRRLWCTANICGNRARVARHYHRTHTGSAPQ